MERQFDVLVVGAGPTGSTAARFAAEAGARTLLLEKRPEIGTPVRCGEGIGRTWLEEVGLRPDAEYLAHEISGLRVFAPDGGHLTVPDLGGGKGGFVVERDLFDRALAKEAAKSGTEILIRATVVGLLKDDGRVVGARCEHWGETFDVHASVVVGADGFESQVGRWAGLTTHLRTRDLVPCLQYTLAGARGESEYSDFYLGSMAPGGYAWIFWKGPDVVNVGLGASLAKLKDRAEVKAYLDRFVAAQPSLARAEVIEEVAGGVSTSLPVERSVADGLILAGDAARLIDPLTGAGIQNGLISGKLAGETAARAAKEGDASAKALMDYERGWRGRLDEELARHYLIKEGLQKLPDTTINAAIHALAGEDLRGITAARVLDLLRTKCPELLAAFPGLL